MEVIGQSFNLPLEDMAITSDDIDIYARWLFEQHTRPIAVVQEGLEQEFYQIIFHQYSLLFQPRITRPFSCNQTIKDTLTPLVQRHVELCKKTLKVFVMAARTLKFSEETWSVTLKVMLGITDYLLKEPTGEASGMINMADELCDTLLQALFELWLRSNVMDVEMWDILKTCFMRWTHRPKAIQQWSSLSLALTKRVQSIIGGEGTDGVYVSEPNIKLDLPPDFVCYAWHRVLYLIPHPLQLTPTNFTLTMLGIRQLVDTLSHTPSSSDGNTLLHMFGTYLFDAASRASSPSLDTESLRGCAEAFVTLCAIFCQPQRRQPFLRTYIEKFYAALLVGVQSHACLPTILLSCTELFAADLEGVRILVPEFIKAIKMVLPKLRIECKVPVDQLRWAAIKVLSTVMCLPNHIHKVELQQREDSADQVTLAGDQEQIVAQLIRVLYAEPQEEVTDKPTLSLKYYILEILLTSLRTETSSHNMRYILHLINVYVIEDVPFCPGLVGTVVKLIQDKILTMQLPNDVIFVAFDVLMDFVDLYDFVKRDSKNVARELVLALSRYVNTLLQTGNLVNTYGLIVQAYECMIRWVLVSQWIIGDKDCCKAVIETLSKGITILEKDTHTVVPPNTSEQPPIVPPEKKKRRDTGLMPPKQLFQLPPRVNKGAHQTTPSNSNTSQHEPSHAPPTDTSRPAKEYIAIRRAAQYCMSLFVNQLGRFALPNELDDARPEMADDLHQLRLYKEKHGTYERCPIRCFMLSDRTLLTIMDTTSHIPSILVVVRDTTGKYAWSIETRYMDKPFEPSNQTDPPKQEQQRQYQTTQPTLSTNKRVTVPKATAVNEAEMPNMEKLFAPHSDNWKELETVKVLIDRQLKAETTQKKPVATVCRTLPACTKVDYELPRGFRLFLSQLGFLLPQNRGHIIPLKMNDTVVSEMEALDMLSERDCISVTVYYAKSGATTWSELVEQLPTPNERFQQFIHCLGWTVDLESHKGYKGRLTPSVCDTTTYYSDRIVEFVAHNPYFLKRPVDGTNVNSLHQQATVDDHTCIIWIEDLADYQTLAERIKQNAATNSKLMVYIFINPLKHTSDTLYWIRIYVPSKGASQRLYENMMILGPLVDGIVVSRHALGSMVRRTAISAHQACRVVMDTFTRPYIVRKEYIKEMMHRHRTILPISE
ncbi:hypothetical protein BCV72DRAFT_247745 [Rhizopus microsporus var. microsporus]|nr:hypothetical protein BCV72DRAFT_247745 [Rhizopus microsporus var. microsporus]